MLRYWLAAILLILLSLGLGPASALASTAAEPTLEEMVLLKKKKRIQLRQAARQDECRGLFNCLFGEPGTRRDSGVMSGRRTARNIDWDETRYPPGSIIIRTPERALYLVLEEGRARRYRVGVGREGFQWSGTSKVVAKQEWPSWRPPAEMIAREAAKGNLIPDYMEGGPRNPLGARALYIGGTLYRIHGTNDSGSIGGAVSSGCIRMMNADVVDLYNRVRIGARVYVYQ